ncbi:hypothetical protein GBA52_014760 [Prunus armeniaca]|nr:hypothetical protein GBA52_014760 [Prunus armeniaca]
MSLPRRVATVTPLFNSGVLASLLSLSQILCVSFVFHFLLCVFAFLMVALVRWFQRVCYCYCADSLQVNEDYGVSCFVGVSGQGEGGFPHAPFIDRSMISSLTFMRRRLLSRDLAWVALHLGSIALVLLFTVLGKVFGN